MNYLFGMFNLIFGPIIWLRKPNPSQSEPEPDVVDEEDGRAAAAPPNQTRPSPRRNEEEGARPP